MIATTLTSLTSLTVFAALSGGGDVPLTPKEYEDVLRAIRIVESGEDPAAVGDGGRAIGVYQIWNVYWRDAVEFSGIGGVYGDCRDPAYADVIVRAYMDRYAVPRRLGRYPTQEDIARIHNGGPNGHRKEATLKYWQKVHTQMEKDKNG